MKRNCFHGDKLNEYEITLQEQNDIVKRKQK